MGSAIGSEIMKKAKIGSFIADSRVKRVQRIMPLVGGWLFFGKQVAHHRARRFGQAEVAIDGRRRDAAAQRALQIALLLSLIHISEPTRPY